MCERERDSGVQCMPVIAWCLSEPDLCVREEKVGKVFVCVSAFAIVYVTWQFVSPYMCVLSLFRERKDE